MSRLTAVRGRNLVDTLPYWELVNGVMFLADGRVEIGAEVNFPPAMFLTSGGLEMMMRQLKNVIRNAVPQGQRLRLMIEVTPSGTQAIAPYRRETTTQEPMAALLGESRALYFEHLAKQPSELLTWRAFLTVSLGTKRLGGAANVGAYAAGSLFSGLRRKTHQSFTEDEFKLTLERAENSRIRLLNFLESAGFAPRVLGDQDVFDVCYRFLNPGLKHIPTPKYVSTWQIVPEGALSSLKGMAPPTLRAQLAKSEIDNSSMHELRIGWKRARMMSLAHNPDETIAGMMNALMDASGEFYLVIDLVHEEFDKAVHRLKGMARRFHSAASDSKVYADPNVRSGLRETEAAIEHIATNGDHVFQVSANLIVVGTDSHDLEDRITRAYSVAAAVPGTPFMVMHNGLMGPFMQSAPFSGESLDQRLSMLETNAVHFFPVGSPWRGAKRPMAMFHNRWKSLTYLDPFDPQMTNWNALIVGGSGQGKTFFAQYLITELTRQDDVDIIIVDRGRGYEKTVELLGGAMIDIEPGGAMSINPFDLEPGQIAPDDEKLAFLGALIRAMVGTVDPRAEAEEDALISAALRTTYMRKTDEVLGENNEYTKRFEGALLRDFVRTLTNLERIGEKTVTEDDRRLADGLARTLQNWTGKTPLGAFVDRPTNIPISSARVVCYDTSKFRLDSPLAAVGTMLIADMVWRRVKANNTRRKIVIFDECWALLEIPAAASFMVELYRRFRRYNAAAWSISQSMLDFQKPQAQGLLQNTNFYYLLRIPGEDEVVQQLLNLSPNALEAFRSLKRISGVYSEVLAWVRREANVEGDVIWVRPSALDYWAFTTTALDMARRQEALDRNGGNLEQALRELAGMTGVQK